jgi:chemotaxis protein CheZ
MTEAARRFRIEGAAGQKAGRSFPSEEARLPGLNDLLVEQASAPSDLLAHGLGDSAASHPDLGVILSELRALRAVVDPMRGIVESLTVTHRAELESVLSLRGEIGEIESAIRGTKKELAAITVGNTIGGVDVAALELTTVVRQTEAATHDILAAGEKIELLAGVIQSDTNLKDAKKNAAAIAEAVTIIYMACNFQDLSGQRVSRVVDTLNFVEARIQKIIDAWGGLQSLHDLIENELKLKDEERATEGAAALLTGPVPVNAIDHVDQDAIDALFN